MSAGVLEDVFHFLLMDLLELVVLLLFGGQARLESCLGLHERVVVGRLLLLEISFVLLIELGHFVVELIKSLAHLALPEFVVLSKELLNLRIVFRGRLDLLSFLLGIILSLLNS